MTAKNKVPDPITLTPETPSVVSWKKQLADRPTDYHVGIVTARPMPSMLVTCMHAS
jgi:hypothetical protein